MANPSNNPLDLLKPSAPGEEKKWYEIEPAEGHRFLERFCSFEAGGRSSGS